MIVLAVTRNSPHQLTLISTLGTSSAAAVTDHRSSASAAMVAPPQLARPPWLFLGLLCLAVPLADSAAESPEATAAPPGRGTAAEMMEEIRSRMNNQWDALQHIRYQALLSKVAVGRLNERVKHLISTLASQGTRRAALRPDPGARGSC